MDVNKLHTKVYSQIRKGGGVLLPVRKMQWAIARITHSFDISSNIDLTGVYLSHNGFGIVINPNSIIGKEFWKCRSHLMEGLNSSPKVIL